MSDKVISYMLSNKNITERLQFQLVLQCAPLLKGLKAACLIILGKGVCADIKNVLVDTGIDCCILSEQNGKYLAFFYQRKAFEEYLQKEDVTKFLICSGYKIGDAKQLLIQLSERICRYSCKNIDFPHEIGAFLGYPIEDVESFVKEGGKNSLFSRYWKVYHNPWRAGMTFYVYDKARQSAVNEYLAGKPFKDIICQISSAEM